MPSMETMTFIKFMAISPLNDIVSLSHSLFVVVVGVVQVDGKVHLRREN